MTMRRKVKVSALRDIGWAEWDPIGLQEIEGGWEGSPAADEYDTYLLQVAGEIMNGHSDDEAAARLVLAEAVNIGMGVGPTTRARALKTVSMIRSYIGTLAAA